MQYDYSLVLLSAHEQKLFDRFANQDTAQLTVEEFKILSSCGLVTDYLGGKSSFYDKLPGLGEYTLSNFGKKLRAYQTKQADAAHTERVRFWVPLIISNVIAFTALVISIIAVLGQLGILQLTTGIS